MHKVTICLFFLASSLYPFVSSANIPAAQEISLDIPSVNWTTITSPGLSAEEPSAVEVKPSAWGHHLRPIACIVNTVHIVGELALEDYEDPIERPKLYRYHDFPDVFFGVIPTEGKTLPRGVVLWGLSKALNLLMGTQTYQEVRFGLVWEKVIVGFIFFRYQKPLPPPPSSSTLSASNPYETGILDAEDNSLALPASNNSDVTIPMFTNTTSLAAIPLKLGMTPLANLIDRNAVIGIVIAGIIRAAILKGTDIVQGDHQFGVPDLGLVLIFSLPKPPRTRPPFFRYEHLIQALIMAVDFMVNVGRWGELKMDCEVGHSLVATGLLLKMGTRSVAGVGTGWTIS